MEMRWTFKPRPAAGLLPFLFLPIFGYAGSSAAQTPPVPTMTIEIYNNSVHFSIYPVLSTGTSLPEDKWLQAAFKVPKAQLGANPYPKPNQFRLYFNPTGVGIPPGGEITLTLPLYTQLVPTNQVDPKLPNQYIDWWGGGRIEIFESPYADRAPPAALTANYTNRPSQVPVTPVAGATLPVCGSCQPLQIFMDPAGLKGNEPSQLTEYTLGAIKLTKDPYEIDIRNVDYDVSYVDAAYLPALMEPFGNIQVGYVGTPLTIAAFKKALGKFLAPGAPFTGWPQFVDEQKEVILKIPSALHVLAGDPDLTPPPWAPINKMKALWQTCTAAGSADQRPICLYMRNVKTLFVTNYNNYQANYTQLGCDASKTPVALTPALLFSHVHGWGPFNEHCGAATNLLEQTPGYVEDTFRKYREVKEEFDGLQYWPNGAFNPYSLLIHGKDYINTPYVYAYSVDDAVGNMQVAGTGLIIAVGGKRGLPNPKPASKPVHVNMGYSSQDKIRFVQYGICTAVPDQTLDPDFTSFDVSQDSLSDCVLSFVDNKDRLYKFTVNSPPPYLEVNERTPETHAPIDCSLNKDPQALAWCNGVFAYSSFVAVKSKTENYVITPAPAQPPP